MLICALTVTLGLACVFGASSYYLDAHFSLRLLRQISDRNPIALKSEFPSIGVLVVLVL